MKCPVCTTEMDQHVRHGVAIDHCPACGGVWLDKGELDHLMAAVRPAVALRDPEPEPARPAPNPRSEPARGSRDTPRTRPEPERISRDTPRTRPERERQEDRERERDEDREREARKSPGKAQRYGRKYSKRIRLKDVIEDIFDFD